MKPNPSNKRLCLQLSPGLAEFLDSFEAKAKRFPHYRFNEYPTRASVARLALRHFQHFIERCQTLLEEGMTFDEAEQAIHRRRGWWQSESENGEFEPGHAAEILPLLKESSK